MPPEDQPNSGRSCSSTSANLSYSTSPTSLPSRPSATSTPVKPSRPSTTTSSARRSTSRRPPTPTSSSSGALPSRSVPSTFSTSLTPHHHRSTILGETKYYLREIKHAFVVGQTYPLNEVPGPHSRKITTLVKNRLQTIAFKLVAKSPHQRIKVHRLTRYFPDQNDLQMRQRLKVRSPSPLPPVSLP